MGTLKSNSGDISGFIPEEDEQCEFSYVHVFNGSSLDGDLYIPNVCWKPWHRKCEAIRVNRMRWKIIKYMEYYDNPKSHWYFVTRSVRNDYELKTAFVDLRLAQQKFTSFQRDNQSHPFNVVTAWVSVTEITWKPKTGYNVHQHMLVQSEKEWGSSQIATLRDYWSRSAGYPAHFNSQPAEDPERAAAYLAKYMSKSCWGGLSRGRAYLVQDTLKGRNRINMKRRTVVPKIILGFLLCCLSPTKHCAHPSMVIPDSQFLSGMADHDIPPR